MSTKKKTIGFISGYAASKGYTLLSKEYINSKTKLLFKHPKGHEFYIRWNSFQQGRRDNPHRLSIEYIKSETTKLSVGEITCVSNSYNHIFMNL